MKNAISNKLVSQITKSFILHSRQLIISHMKTRTNYLFVIGIDRYESADFDNLNNAVSDATAIIGLLTSRYGFELFPAPLFNENATKENIYKGLNDLLLTAGKEDNLVIYFSGHGLMHPIGGQGYWIPYEAKNSFHYYIENSVVKDFIQRILAKHIFLIADSCFAGTFLTQTRSSGHAREYQDMDQRVSRWVLTSGGEEPVSDGVKGGHSPFAHYLIRFLTVNDNRYFSVHELIRYAYIMTEHNSRQQPNGAPIENIGHDGGQLVFTLKNEFVKEEKDKSRGLPNCRKLLEEIRAYESQSERLPAGKEILLIESFLKDGELQIVELFRFDEKGKKKHHFEDGKLKMLTADQGEVSWNVIQRFATWQGLTRYWDKNKERYKTQNLTVLRAHESIDQVENTEAAIDYSDVLKDMVDGNPEPLRCLHCGEVIATNESSMVEIDEIGLRATAGNVHDICLRPLDRILRKPIFSDEKFKNLLSFDSTKWLELLSTGQFHWRNALQASNHQPIWMLIWNREHAINSGEYCIRQILSNGQTKYIRLGKEIHRFSAREIDDEVNIFQKELEESQGKGDPIAYTNKQYLFGTVSELEKRKLPEEEILHIVNIEKVKYSRQIESENTKIANDYAPVGLVITPGTMQVLNLGNCIPLIFDPMLFDRLHENWNEVGYKVGQCTIKIIESDREFDFFLMNVFEDGMQPIAHPMFEKNKELISGTYIQDIKKITEPENLHRYLASENGVWKEGDAVRVVFPNRSQEKSPEGVLLSDEFIDEKNEACAIFCPVENSVKLTQFAVKLPVKLLRKRTE